MSQVGKVSHVANDLAPHPHFAFFHCAIFSHLIAAFKPSQPIALVLNSALSNNIVMLHSNTLCNMVITKLLKTHSLQESFLWQYLT